MRRRLGISVSLGLLAYGAGSWVFSDELSAQQERAHLHPQPRAIRLSSYGFLAELAPDFGAQPKQ
jgi:hypothetical protein